MGEREIFHWKVCRGPLVKGSLGRELGIKRFGQTTLKFRAKNKARSLRVSKISNPVKDSTSKGAGKMRDLDRDE